MTRFVFLALCSVLLVRAAFAQVQDKKSFFEGFLRSADRSGPPIFLSNCAEKNGYAMLFFQVGQKTGRFAEFSANGLQANGTTETFSGAEFRIGELMMAALGRSV